jgi:hypothetical protein
MKNFAQSAIMAALLLGAGSAHAQITFAPKVGLNIATLKETLSDDAKKNSGSKASEYKSKIGASFGLMLNARFGNIAIQPALTYSMKGAKIDDEVTTTSTIGGFTSTTKTVTTGSNSLGYCEIPINFTYTTGGDKGFQVFAGPYLGFGIGGKYDYKNETTTTISGGGGTTTAKVDSKGDIEFNGSPTASEAEKAGNDDKLLLGGLDYGLNFGLGYLINNIQIQASYGLGLGNLEPKYPDQKASQRGTLQNRVISLTAAYIIGGSN